MANIKKISIDGTSYNIPGTTYGIASTTALGLIRTNYTQSGQNYPVKVDSSGNAYVYVPWSDANSWRPITNTYTGSDQNTSLSQYGANALYNALVNGYASSAGNADTVDSEHASAFAHRGTANNLLIAGNEFNFISAGFNGSVWFNYQDENRANGSNITDYFFGNGRSDSNPILHAGGYQTLSNSSAYALTSDGGVAHIGSMSVNYANSAGSVAWGNVSGKPSSMPASDVSSWAKASTKPSYTKSEIGLGNVDNTADSQKSVNYANSAGSAGSATYAVNATRLYASDPPYRYGDGSPYYAYLTYNDYEDGRWYMKVYPASPATIRVDYATSAGSAPASDVYSWAKAASKPSYSWSEITSKPGSMPASDVYSWAKASTKPSYAWSEITSKPSTFTPSSHSHAWSEISDKPIASTTALGLIKTNYSQQGQNYPVNVDSSGNAYVYVPWTDTNTDTNTWRPITNTYTGSDQSTSVSQYGANALYNALVNGYASSAGTASYLSGFTNTTTSGTAIDSATNNGHFYVTGTSGIFNQSDGSAFVQAYSTSWVSQIYQDYRTGQIALRGRNNGTWQSWRKVLDSVNYTTYVPQPGTGLSLGESNRLNVTYGTSASTACQGNDSRLSDARPASDVYSWAKASTKPSYSWSEITSKPTTFTPASHSHELASASSGGMISAENFKKINASNSVEGNAFTSSTLSIDFSKETYFRAAGSQFNITLSCNIGSNTPTAAKAHVLIHNTDSSRSININIPQNNSSYVSCDGIYKLVIPPSKVGEIDIIYVNSKYYVRTII